MIISSLCAWPRPPRPPRRDSRFKKENSRAEATAKHEKMKPGVVHGIQKDTEGTGRKEVQKIFFEMKLSRRL